VSVWPASLAALRGAVSHERPLGEPQMHLPERFWAHIQLRRARSNLRPTIHARARGAAASAAIRSSMGCPLGRNQLHRGAPLGLRSRASAPRALASRDAFCRPPATYERAVRRRPVLPRSFILTSACAHPPTVEFFPPLLSARHAGGRPPHLPATVEFFPPFPPAWHAGGGSPPSPCYR